MSVAEAYLERPLKLNVQSYFRGKMPSQSALSNTPHLERWRVERVYEHIEYPSSILLKDTIGSWVTPRNPTAVFLRWRHWSSSTATAHGQGREMASTGSAIG